MLSKYHFYGITLFYSVVDILLDNKLHITDCMFYTITILSSFSKLILILNSLADFASLKIWIPLISDSFITVMYYSFQLFYWLYADYTYICVHVLSIHYFCVCFCVCNIKFITKVTWVIFPQLLLLLLLLLLMISEYTQKTYRDYIYWAN